MTSGTVRQAYLDRVRGLAVLIMIAAHVLDSWTRLADRTRPAFGYAMVLGGMGAPLFLFLAGVAVVLSAESKARKDVSHTAAWRAAGRRGWQVFGLAFLFRVQSYVLSGFFSAASLLKVDILNIMGPAMVMVAAAGRKVERPGVRAGLFGVIAVGISLLTPIVRATPLLSWLPDPVEWYVRPSPGRTNFTLFPWSGFVFSGAAIGVAIAGGAAGKGAVRVQLGIAAGALLLGPLAYWASFQPSLYASSEFWTSAPTFFLIRVALVALVLPVAFLWHRAPWHGVMAAWSPLETLGRSSLFVYWVHVEMAYGFFSRPLRRSLSLEGVFVAYIVFTLFLLVLVLAKNRFVASI